MEDVKGLFLPPMIKNVLFKVLILTTAIAISQSACNEDKCTAVACMNDGVCVYGTCSCVYGYEGDLCESVWTDKFTGTWQVKETGKGGVVLSEYDISIGRYASVDSLFILGINDVDDTVFAKREAFKSFSLAPRMLASGDSVISGEAFLGDSNVVTGVYSLWKDSVQQNISFSFTR